MAIMTKIFGMRLSLRLYQHYFTIRVKQVTSYRSPSISWSYIFRFAGSMDGSKSVELSGSLKVAEGEKKAKMHFYFNVR